MFSWCGCVHELRDPEPGRVLWGCVFMFRIVLQPQPQPKARRRSTEWMRDPLAQCLAYYCPVARANRVFLYTSASKPDVGKNLLGGVVDRVSHLARSDVLIVREKAKL